MSKSLNLKAALACLAACAVTITPVAAQNPSNGQLLGAGLKEQYSAGDFSSILSEFNIQSALAPYGNDGVSSLLAVTEGGARFIISLFNCDDPAAGSGCRGALIFTGISNAGVAYDDLNAFNGNAEVTTAVNVADQNVIMFTRQMFFAGGVGKKNIKYVMALFLVDMQKFVEGKAAAGTAVSWRLAPDESGKLGNLTSVGADKDLAPPPRFSISQDSVSKAVSAAISNSFDVDFSIEQTSGE